MKAQIDIYTGFLGSGKTSLIKQSLRNHQNSNERIVVILCEEGEEAVNETDYPQNNVFIKRLTKHERLEKSIIKSIYNKYQPDRIIIEQNGMSSVEELLGVLDERCLRKFCNVNSIFNVIDCRTFDMLMNLTGSNLIEQISNSDLIILNYFNTISKQRINSIKKTIKTFNTPVILLSIEAPQDFGEYLLDSIKMGNKKLPKATDILLAEFFILATVYFLATLYSVRDSVLSDINLHKLQILNTVFISILMQAFPFLLLGVLLSSVIQIFVSKEMVIRYFPKSKTAAFITALLGGLFFPVCDCAIVPVASQLVKKGVPLYSAITFMLAAPIVNPLVIASTLYAFPGKQQIAVYRVFLGIIIATASGLFFLFFPPNEKNLFTQYKSLMCNCTYCSTTSEDSFTNRISSVFKHAGEEFFDVGRFLVAGALITSVFQVFIPTNMFQQIGSSGIYSLFIMMAAAVVLSVCSSSDAFIASSFATRFSLGSVMGFLVLGPMVDIKNILILFGSFNKRFVLSFLLVVCVLSFVILMFFTPILF